MPSAKAELFFLSQTLSARRTADVKSQHSYPHMGLPRALTY